MLSIIMPVGNSPLSLAAALRDLSNPGGVLSSPKNFSLCLIHQAYPLKVFAAKKSPVCFVKGTHLSPS